MTHSEKKQKISALASGMLKQSYEAMEKKIEKALNVGAIDVDGWDENNAPMILPKCIVMALLLDESEQYSAKGTSFERQIKKEVLNIRQFI